MGGGGPVCPPLVEGLEQGQGQGAPLGGVGGRAQFVQKDEGRLRQAGEHRQSPLQVGRKGAEALGQVLGVADVGEDRGKGAELAALVHGNRDAALDHEGQEAQGLQGHGFAAGVGPGDDEKAVLRGELQINGDDVRGGAVLPALLHQEGVAGLAEVHAALTPPDGFPGPELLGKFDLGLDGVQLAQGRQGQVNFRQNVPHQVGEPAQHRFFFPLFPVVEEIQGVVVLHDGQGFEIQGGPGLGLVVDDAGNGALVVGLDGNDVAAVALGNEGTLEGVLVGRLEKVLFDLAVDPLPGLGQLPAHLGQAGAGLIQDKVVGADALLKDLRQGGQVLKIIGQGRQARGQFAP